jgi:hypothetical protein
MSLKKNIYDYRPVYCPNCGWRGKRSLSTNWSACPKCHAPGHTILPRRTRRVDILIEEIRRRDERIQTFTSEIIERTTPEIVAMIRQAIERDVILHLDDATN